MYPITIIPEKIEMSGLEIPLRKRFLDWSKDTRCPIYAGLYTMDSIVSWIEYEGVEMLGFLDESFQEDFQDSLDINDTVSE